MAIYSCHPLTPKIPFTVPPTEPIIDEKFIYQNTLPTGTKVFNHIITYKNGTTVTLPLMSHNLPKGTTIHTTATSTLPPASIDGKDCLLFCVALILAISTGIAGSVSSEWVTYIGGGASVIAASPFVWHLCKDYRRKPVITEHHTLIFENSRKGSD